VLLVLAPFMRVRVPQARHLPQIALLGTIGIAAYNMALSTGETQVSAGAASLLVNYWSDLLRNSGDAVPWGSLATIRPVGFAGQFRWCGPDRLFILERFRVE
jgi:hypothetical protein